MENSLAYYDHNFMKEKNFHIASAICLGFNTPLEIMPVLDNNSLSKLIFVTKCILKLIVLCKYTVMLMPFKIPISH